MPSLRSKLDSALRLRCSAMAFGTTVFENRKYRTIYSDYERGPLHVCVYECVPRKNMMIRPNHLF